MKRKREQERAGTSHAVMDDFDVFLNHRGPDVKATFVAHLEEALSFAGFRPFLDARSLMKGNPALKSIDQALDVAKVHVAVVSKRYAESKYCLKELVAMMRSGKPVIPVFYDVEPVDLRWVENGPFAQAFEKHKSRGRTETKLQEWRDALGALAGITGFRLADYKGDEAQLKREVVDAVARLTPSNEAVEVEECTVGLEGPKNSCIQMLQNMDNGIGMLGLVGMGGIGKSTLAREIYNHFVAEKKFRHMTFLEIHRDSSSSNVHVGQTWSRKLRKQLLRDLLFVYDSSSNYKSWFQKMATLGAIFIVIDDIYKLGQFEDLIPCTSHLHPGSRIVVTSRDRSVLDSVLGRAQVEHQLIYDVSTLKRNESNMLFSWHAFHSWEAPEAFKGLAKDVVRACDGLPLALKVVGSSLFNKRSHEDMETIWPEAVDALRQSPDVMGVLRWSYDNLPNADKFMFVDIACLFYHERIEMALAYWKSCKNCTSCGGLCTPHTSLRNLINKNLVNQDSGFFKVHDLLRDLGQEIGRKAKTHFVNDEMAEAIVTKYQGKENIIALNLARSQKLKFDAESFANMPNLHFLGLPYGCSLNGDLRHISKELRWLQWRGMPYTCIPTNLNLSMLTSLDFSRSTNLALLWTDSNNNFEGYPNLLRLDLSRCTSILKLPNSIGQLSSLQDLIMEGCEKLELLPESIGQLKGLKHLSLSDCRSLEALPDTLGQLSSQLQTLSMVGCENLKMIPESIGQLKALEGLWLTRCKSLKAIPDTLGALPNLQKLYASGCNSLEKFPTSIRLVSRLEELTISSAILERLQFPDDMMWEAWTLLKNLELTNCCGVASLLGYGALESLERLDIHDNTLTEFRESFGLMTRLKSLRLDCEKLQRLPESFGLLWSLDDLGINCKQLQCLPDSIGDLKMLKFLMLDECHNLESLPETLGGLRSLLILTVSGCPIRELPWSIGILSQLGELTLVGCKNLQKLPTSIRYLYGLEMMELMNCGSIEAMGALTTLQGLPIWGSTSITKLPASLGMVSHLVVWNGERYSMPWHYRSIDDKIRDAFLNGTGGQVLEENESGFLKAYYFESSGVIRLLRGVHLNEQHQLPEMEW